MRASLLALLYFACTGAARGLSLRRFAAAALSPLALLSASPVLAVQLQGTVSIGADVASTTGKLSDGASALYITVRQDKGVWSDRVRNFKPPPVLSKRISAPMTFPLSFTLDSDADSTEEGAALAREWKTGRNPLLVAARLDADGVAATRSPDDLTGQATVELKDGAWGKIDMVLEGRGLTGRFITQPRQ